MQLRKESPAYAIMEKAICPNFRQSNNKRQFLQPNPIFLMDFAETRERYSIKKKRYPLFLKNKFQKKRNGQNSSVFTNQGILFQTVRSSEIFAGLHCKKKQTVSKMQSNSFVTKKQTLNSAFNFTRTFSPKKVKYIDCAKDFTPFHLYPQGRFLQSAQGNRQIAKLVKKRSNSTQIKKQKFKTEGNLAEEKQIGAWRTIDVEFDYLI